MNPLLSLLGAHLLSVIIYPFASDHHLIRPGIFVLITLCCAISITSTDKNTWWGIDLAQYACGFVMNSSYVIFLQNKMPSRGDSRLQSFKKGCMTLFSSRDGYEGKDLPAFRRGEPGYVPSKKEFLIGRSWTFAWTTAFFIFIQTHPLSLSRDDFASPNDSLLRRLLNVSPREWVILAHTTFSIWFLPYCLLTSAHSLAAILAVNLGGAPIGWRPLFGDIREAYTVQRFFGVFWHKLMRRAFTAHASFFIHDILRLGRGSPSRTAIVFVSFLISGAMHAVVSPLPLHCAGLRVLSYYCGLGALIMCENGLIRVYDRWCHRRADRSSGVIGHSKLCYIAGYVWVTFFHLWTTAKVVYPNVFCAQRESTTDSPKSSARRLEVKIRESTFE